jgi:hypothetical protein
MSKRVRKANRGVDAAARTHHDRMSKIEYDRIQNALVEHDRVVTGYENRWGVDRLQELVSQDLRHRFLMQRDKLNEAISRSDGKRVQHEVQVMCRAYAALEKAAIDAGYKELTGEYWEMPMPDGRVLAVTRTITEAGKVARDNRDMVVYSLEELANLLYHKHKDTMAKVDQVKSMFPGAAITKVKPKTTAELIDDEIPF